MATATLRALRLAFPSATIHLAVGPAARAAVIGNPRIDTLLDPGSVGSGRTAWQTYVQLARTLRAGGYDTAITLDRSPVLGLLPLLAGIPRRVGLDSDGRGFAHTVRIPAPPASPRHEAEVYLDTLRAIALTPTEPRLEFFPTEDERLEIRDWRLENTPQSLISNLQSPLILIHPAGGVNPGMTLLAKRWPAARFAQLADRLTADGAQVTLVGGPGDGDVAAEVKAALRQPVLDLTGRVSFGALGALASQAALYIGNDTGATHLAVAVGAPTIMLMGPTDPRRYSPYRPSAPDTVAAVCPPDARSTDYLALRYAAQGDTGPTDIRHISVEHVYAVTQRLLGGR